MADYKKVYADFFGIGPECCSPCERCIVMKELGRGESVAQAVDIHHAKFRSQGGEDVPENLAGLCRSCHDIMHSQPEENELIIQWCKELETRMLVIRAFLFRSI